MGWTQRSRMQRPDPGTESLAALLNERVKRRLNETRSSRPGPRGERKGDSATSLR